jgi:mono/diheme cytochrome c family protein
MKQEEQKAYLEKYAQAKKKGFPFYPDIIFKDAIAALIVFLILVALAYFVGAPLESRADPADTSYTPTPEWYFIFLFQLLKYFPGSLEVLGVVVLPTLVILLLFVLPFLDRSPKRNYAGRPIVIGVTIVMVIGIVFLTIQSVREAPPPAEAAEGDQVAVLYTKNCATCHGSSITLPADANLHMIIAEGKHEGMPAWSADLTSDQIDALAGFIASPGGNQLFTDNCSECHAITELVAGSPLDLKNALEQGQNFPPHSDVELPDWSEDISAQDRTVLLNFLIAPDGQRLFTINCSPCHGQSVAYSGEEGELRQIISSGGMHSEMPPWQERLSDTELDTLSKYVVDPAAAPEGQALFQGNCAACHGERVPAAVNTESARQTIATGGTHQTMPLWGEVLTEEQLDALVSYTLNAARGTSLEIGRELFANNCTVCHGDFGEGGPNPARAGDIIAPISTTEYLKTRDDATLRAIIAQGQPNFGMSPFGSSFGGPLDDDEVDAIVAYIRSWEANPPVELPPEITYEEVALSSADIFHELCVQCHGPEGEGDIGPSLVSPEFKSRQTKTKLFENINMGHEATAMIGWGEILSADQIQDLVDFIIKLEPVAERMEAKPSPTPRVTGAPSFNVDVLPIFEVKCTFCHGELGGWDGSSYEAVMTTGNNAPVIIPGDPENSLLAQKLLGTHTEGTIMPPGSKLPDDEIQVVLDWIEAGTPE